MRYDLYYIKHRSVWLDLRILFETMNVLLFDQRNHETVRRPVVDSWHDTWHRPASRVASR
jgi:hypothetical protein